MDVDHEAFGTLEVWLPEHLFGCDRQRAKGRGDEHRSPEVQVGVLLVWAALRSHDGEAATLTWEPGVGLQGGILRHKMTCHIGVEGGSHPALNNLRKVTAKRVVMTADGFQPVLYAKWLRET